MQKRRRMTGTCGVVAGEFDELLGNDHLPLLQDVDLHLHIRCLVEEYR